MNSIYKLLTVFLGLTYSLLMFSQENFVSGYIIKLNGDTLKGFVDYRNWSKNPNIISFKESITSNIKDYKPLEINAFAVKDEIYKSAIIKADQSNNIYGISSGPEFEFRTDTAFVLTIIQGYKSLYYYCDKYHQDNFYIFNNSKYELLEFKKYNRVNEHEPYENVAHEGLLFLEMNNRYIGQLKFYLYDCKNIESKFQNISYSRGSIKKLFEYYYSQMNPGGWKVKKEEKLKVEAGVIGGLCMTSLDFVQSDALSDYTVFDYLTKVNFKNDVSLTGGVYLNIIIPRSNGKWSFYNELLFNSYTFKEYYSTYTNAQYYKSETYTLGYYYLKMNNLIRYKYPIGNFYFYANAGISNGIAFKELNNDMVEKRYYSEYSLINQKAIDETRLYEQGLLLGLGIIYHRISAEFRYEASNGILVYTNLGQKTDRYNFLLGYRF